MITKEIIDWTIPALKKRINEARSVGDEDLASVLVDTIFLYDVGLIDIAWVSGQPQIKYKK